MSHTDQFEIPDEWKLSMQQEIVIGSLIDEKGKFISAYQLREALYLREELDNANENDPAPAKLRVLIQRCREIVAQLTDGRAKIQGRRGKGWRITKRNRVILMAADKG